MKEYTIKISDGDIFLLIGLAAAEADRYADNDLHTETQNMLRRIEVQMRMQGGPSAERIRQYEDTISKIEGR